MNRIQLIPILCLLTSTLFAQGVGVGTATPDASAALEVASTDKGVLIPRMSSTDRQNIVDPAIGLMVYDSTAGAFYYFTGNGWLELLGGSVDKITDQDGDTRIEVEKTPDEDVIHLSVGGSSGGNIRRNANGKVLHWFAGGGGSLYIGEHCGTNVGDAVSNVCIGFSAGNALTNGNFNLFLGRQAGQFNATGGDNVFLGAYAGQSSAGDKNVFLGRSAGSNCQGSGNIFLGSFAGLAETGSNKLYIENSSSASPLIYGDFDLNLLRINGTLNINNAFSFPLVDGTEGQVLRTNGNGTLNWIDPRDELILPDTALPIPIKYHSIYLYVSPEDNATSISWDSAQVVCNDLIAHGFDDWYLPSLNELNAMYKQSYLITGLEESSAAKYWSSTENDVASAFTQRLDYGGPDPDDKLAFSVHRCRCIRRD